jgi:hypothetical protein
MSEKPISPLRRRMLGHIGQMMARLREPNHPGVIDLLVRKRIRHLGHLIGFY